MIEALQKEIEVEKEVLSTLPKNNKKNIEKYKDDISKEIDKYKIKQEEVRKEMLARKDIINNKLPKEEEKNNDLSLSKILEEYRWFSKYNTSYEKMDFDRILYTMSKDKITYEKLNEIINHLIIKYKDAGINLKASDLSYSPIFYEYMNVFFQNINNQNNKQLNDAFEKLYWKEPNIINHIELTFKSLYYKYKSSFDEYCTLKQQKVLKEFNGNIINQYKNEKIAQDKQEISIVKIYNKFVNKELNPSDFTKEKIDQVMGNYIDISKVTDENRDSVVNEFTKLKHTLEEYSRLIKYNYVIEDLKKLYEERDKSKPAIKDKISGIKKSEQKINDFAKKVYLLNDDKKVKLGFIYKLTKRMWYVKNKANKDAIIDKLYMDIDNQITETKVLYDELETEQFNEKVLSLQGNDEIISLLQLANSYYKYQDKLLEEQDLNINDVIKEINELIMSPYNNLINNVNIENNKDMKQIIKDKYELSSINVPEATLDDPAAIASIINDIDKIIYYSVISKSNLTVEEILYIYTIDNVLK